MSSSPIALPVLGVRPERADAARNRSALIDAAARLLRDRGVEGITMDAVACEAGVGKGTLFRRFGDRASLFRALLDESERAFQDAFIRGPAPLGPGASAAERLYAFGCALLTHIERHGEVMVAAQSEQAVLRLGHPTHLARRLHVITLLTESGWDVAEASYLADSLLATLEPALVVHQRTSLAMSTDELRAGWRALVAAVTGPAPAALTATPAALTATPAARATPATPAAPGEAGDGGRDS